MPVAMLCLLYSHLPGTRHSRGLTGATAKIFSLSTKIAAIDEIVDHS